jgi:N-acetyl-gamma-glutamyl-phosphate reductase
MKAHCSRKLARLCGPMYSCRVRAVVFGASGWSGGELLRLLAAHPDLEIAGVAGHSSAHRRLVDVHPQLVGELGDLELASADELLGDLDGIDVAFSCVPHGAAMGLVKGLVGKVPTIVDLSADFRFSDPATYEAVYGRAHEAPELLSLAATGIPELAGTKLAGASLVAVAGCYVTASVLALAPLIESGLVERTGIVVDALSGVSGAGRSSDERYDFAVLDGSASAYGLLRHRHGPEIEGLLGAEVLFTPHLVPMTRGILATCYARLSSPASSSATLRAALSEAYAGKPFVRVVEEPPATKWTLGTNLALVGAWADARTGWAVAIGALDNLGKGAAGQAVQCANLALGLSEQAGLSRAGLVP